MKTINCANCGSEVEVGQACSCGYRDPASLQGTEKLTEEVIPVEEPKDTNEVEVETDVTKYFSLEELEGTKDTEEVYPIELNGVKVEVSMDEDDDVAVRLMCDPNPDTEGQAKEVAKLRKSVGTWQSKCKKVEKLYEESVALQENLTKEVETMSKSYKAEAAELQKQVEELQKQIEVLKSAPHATQLDVKVTHAAQSAFPNGRILGFVNLEIAGVKFDNLSVIKSVKEGKSAGFLSFPKRKAIIQGKAVYFSKVKYPADQYDYINEVVSKAVLAAPKIQVKQKETKDQTPQDALDLSLQAKDISDALFNDKLTEFGGAKFGKSKDGNARGLTLYGLNFWTQNKTLNSKWAQLARDGAQIIHIYYPRKAGQQKSDYYGKIIDGKFEAGSNEQKNATTEQSAS